MGTANSIDALDKLIIYDGVCMFCDTSIDFILENELDDSPLLFTHIQSETAKAVFEYYRFPSNYEDSVLFLAHGELITKSSAALEIAKYLKSPYNWVRAFRYTPLFFRDFVYEIVAKYRYRIFGKYESCQLPDIEDKKRFLE